MYDYINTQLTTFSLKILPIFARAKTDLGFVVVAPLGVHQLQVVAQIALKCGHLAQPFAPAEI